MRSKNLIFLLLLSLLVFLVPGTVRGDVTIEDIELGEHVCGEKWTTEALKGHTVLLFFWDAG